MASAASFPNPTSWKTWRGCSTKSSPGSNQPAWNRPERPHTGSEPRPCGADVAGNLFVQRGERREGLLLAQLFHEREFHLLAVNILVEVQQMRLDAELRRGAFQGWTATNVHHGAVRPAPDGSVNGIHPVWGQSQSRHLQIGRGESDFPAELIAADDLSGERIGPSQHLAGSV